MHKPLQQEIREAREHLDRCEKAEREALNNYCAARQARRVAEYRLSQVRQLSEIER